jgi:hypothetical protein
MNLITCLHHQSGFFICGCLTEILHVFLISPIRSASFIPWSYQSNIIWHDSVLCEIRGLPGSRFEDHCLLVCNTAKSVWYIQTFRKDSAFAIIYSNEGSSSFLFGMCLADYTDSYSRTRLATVGLLLLKHRVTQFAPNPCSVFHFTTIHPNLDLP